MTTAVESSTIRESVPQPSTTRENLLTAPIPQSYEDKRRMYLTLLLEYNRALQEAVNAREEPTRKNALAYATRIREKLEKEYPIGLFFTKASRALQLWIELHAIHDAFLHQPQYTPDAQRVQQLLKEHEDIVKENLARAGQPSSHPQPETKPLEPARVAPLRVGDTVLDDQTARILAECERHSASPTTLPLDEENRRSLHELLFGEGGEGTVRVTGMDRNGIYFTAEAADGTRLSGRIGRTGTVIFAEKVVDGKRTWVRIDESALQASYTDEKTRSYRLAWTIGKHERSLDIMKRIGRIYAGVGYRNGVIGISLEHAMALGVRAFLYLDHGKVRHAISVDSFGQLRDRKDLEVSFVEETVNGKTTVRAGVTLRHDPEGRKTTTLYYGAGGWTVRHSEIVKPRTYSYVEYTTGSGEDRNIIRLRGSQESGRAVVLYNLETADLSRIRSWELAYLMPLRGEVEWGLSAGKFRDERVHFGINLAYRGARFIVYHDGERDIKYRFSVDDVRRLLGKNGDRGYMTVSVDHDGRFRIGIRQPIDQYTDATLYISDRDVSGSLRRHVRTPQGTHEVELEYESNLRGMGIEYTFNGREYDVRFKGRLLGENGKPISDVSAALLKNAGEWQFGFGIDPSGWNTQIGLRRLGVRAIIYGNGQYRISLEDLNKLINESDESGTTTDRPFRFVPVTITGEDGKTQVTAGIEYIMDENRERGERTGAILLIHNGRAQAEVFKENTRTGERISLRIDEEKIKEFRVRKRMSREGRIDAGYHASWGWFAEYLHRFSRDWSAGVRWREEEGGGFFIRKDLLDGVYGELEYMRGTTRFNVGVSELAVPGTPTTISGSINQNGELELRARSIEGNVVKETVFFTRSGRVAHSYYDQRGRYRWDVSIGRGGVSAGWTQRIGQHTYANVSYSSNNTRVEFLVPVIRSGEVLIGAGVDSLFRNPVGMLSLQVRGPGGFPVPVIDYSLKTGKVGINTIGIVLFLGSHLIDVLTRPQRRRAAQERQRNWEATLTYATNAMQMDAKAKKERGRIKLDELTYLLPTTEAMKRAVAISDGVVVASRTPQGLIKIRVRAKEGEQIIDRDYVIREEEAREVLGVLGENARFEEGARQIVIVREGGNTKNVIQEKPSEVQQFAQLLQKYAQENVQMRVMTSMSGDIRVVIGTEEQEETYLFRREDAGQIARMITEFAKKQRISVNGPVGIAQALEMNGVILFSFDPTVVGSAQRRIRTEVQTAVSVGHEIARYVQNNAKNNEDVINISAHEEVDGTHTITVTITGRQSQQPLSRTWRGISSAELSLAVFELFGKEAVERGRAVINQNDDFVVGAQITSGQLREATSSDTPQEIQGVSAPIAG